MQRTDVQHSAVGHTKPPAPLVVVHTVLVSPTAAAILALTVSQQSQLCSLVPAVTTANCSAVVDVSW